MKNKVELNVDVIGGEGTLTAAEEKALNAYFLQKKLKKAETGKKNGSAKHVANKQPLETA